MKKKTSGYHIFKRKTIDINRINNGACLLKKKGGGGKE
jgi:hypothetical protein